MCRLSSAMLNPTVLFLFHQIIDMHAHTAVLMAIYHVYPSSHWCPKGLVWRVLEQYFYIRA